MKAHGGHLKSQNKTETQIKLAFQDEIKHQKLVKSSKNLTLKENVHGASFSLIRNSYAYFFMLESYRCIHDSKYMTLMNEHAVFFSFVPDLSQEKLIRIFNFFWL